MPAPTAGPDLRAIRQSISILRQTIDQLKRAGSMTRPAAVQVRRTASELDAWVGGDNPRFKRMSGRLGEAASTLADTQENVQQAVKSATDLLQLLQHRARELERASSSESGARRG